MISPINADMYLAIWKKNETPKILEIFQRIPATAKNYNNANSLLDTRDYVISDDVNEIINTHGLAGMDKSIAIVDDELKPLIGMEGV